MVIHWSWFRKEVVFGERGQSTRNLGQSIGEHVDLNSPKADVQFSVQRLHCPSASSKAKDTENCRFTLLQTKKQVRLYFRIIVSAHQLSLYGAVAEMCEEYESLHDRSGQLVKVMDNQLCSVRSRQKFLWRMIRIFFCSDMKNELRGFDNNIK